MPTVTIHRAPPAVTVIAPASPKSEEKASLVENIGNEQAESGDKESLSSWYEDWEIKDDDTWAATKEPQRLGKN